MRKLLILLSAIFLFQACATSNSVVSTRLIQKRKYTRGWHVNRTRQESEHRKPVDISTLEPPVNIVTLRIEKDTTSFRTEEQQNRQLFSERVEEIPESHDEPYLPPGASCLRPAAARQSQHSETQHRVHFMKISPTKPEAPLRKTEPIGLVSAVLGILSVLLIILILGELFEIVALMLFSLIIGAITCTLAIISLCRISRNKEHYKGPWLAYLGLVSGILLLVLGSLLGLLLFAFS